MFFFFKTRFNIILCFHSFRVWGCWHITGAFDFPSSLTELNGVLAYFGSRLFILWVWWNNFPISCWLSPRKTQTSITPCYSFHTCILWRLLFKVIWVVQILVWLLDRYVCHEQNGASAHRIQRTPYNSVVFLLTDCLSPKIVFFPFIFQYDRFRCE